MNRAKRNMSLVDAEIKEALNWLCEETERISLQLEAKGLKKGLDGNHAAFVPVNAEFARRMKAIGEKYGLTKEEQ